MPIILPVAAQIDRCVNLLRQGEIIGLPTETVYGLAADACNEAALTKIYQTKARPRFNPLICHIGDTAMAAQLGVLNKDAIKLAEAFWPGPLTLIVSRRNDCPVGLLASAGLGTLALRCPAHELAQQILQKFGGALAAPSANPSGRLSPTTAQHVATMLPDIPVLDGGACSVGVESTIIGCFNNQPIWLRAGGLARSDIEATLKRKLVDIPQEKNIKAHLTPLLSPGRLVRHYAPTMPLRINARGPFDDALWLGFGAQDKAADANLSQTGNLAEAAANLFALLHRLDGEAEKQGKALAVSPVPQDGLGDAINDRLTRAAAKDVQ